MFNNQDPLEIGRAVIENGLTKLVKEMILAPKEIIREHLIKIYFRASNQYIEHCGCETWKAQDFLYTLELLIDCLGDENQ